SSPAASGESDGDDRMRDGFSVLREFNDQFCFPVRCLEQSRTLYGSNLAGVPNEESILAAPPSRQVDGQTIVRGCPSLGENPQALRRCSDSRQCRTIS